MPGVNKFVEWGLVTIVVGCALAFGAVQPLAYSLMEAGVLILMTLVLIAQARRGTIDVPVPFAMLPIILLVVLQTVPLPPQLLAFCSPARLLPTTPAPLEPAGSAWTTLSIYPHQTRDALAKLLAYCGVFVLSSLVFDSHKKRSTLVKGLIFLGCFEAIYGIVQYLTGFQKIFTYTKRWYTEEATGTYINRNHFAGLLELVIPLLVAQIFYLVVRRNGEASHGISQRRYQSSSSPAPQVLFYSFVVVVMLVGVFYSRSRMGVFSIVMSLILMALLGQLKIRRRAWVLVTLVILAAAAGYAFWIGVDPVFRRFELLRQGNSVESSEGRLLLWRGVFPLIKSYPVFGTGLGTFGLAYRRFQNVFVEYFAQHAHSDYLEFTSELGLLGALLLFAPIFYLLGKMVYAFLTEERRYRHSILLGCIGSVSAMLVHTAVDFNLQIPANALLFSIILGIGYKVACVEPRIRAVAEQGSATADPRPAKPEAAGAPLRLT